MKILISFLVFILIPLLSFAEVKLVFDTTTWTPRQKVLLEAIAYRIAWKNGENIIPKKEYLNNDFNKAVLIFENLTQQTKQIIEQTILTEIQTEEIVSETNRQAEVTKENSLKNSAKNKLKAFGLTDDEIGSLLND